jgi:DNA polymerase
METIQRIALQHVRSMRLLGVDFVTVNPPRPGSAAAAGEQMLGEDPESRVTTNHAAENDKSLRLNDLRIRHDRDCTHCTTATYHTQTVFGEGDPNAKVMFIGEAPGEEEDRTGRPFVGRAGQKLNDIIKAMGLAREQVYIANILKSRPPENRTPLEHEVQACSPFLAEQIRIIQPMVIVALGGPSAKFLLQTDTGITKLRGIWGTYQTPDGGLTVPVMPTFHPAFLLRQYTRENREKVWSDMQAILAKLRDLG